MNENLNLVEILKDCPEGTKLYSPVFGEVKFESINDIIGPIIVTTNTGNAECFTADGKIYTYYKKMYNYYNGECLLFPSKDQRDWSKFKIKKPKFDPKTLHPFDKVLVRDINSEKWKIQLFSHIIKNCFPYEYHCIGSCYNFCIPYNDDTKHLVETNEEAPEFYRYWED